VFFQCSIASNSGQTAFRAQLPAMNNEFSRESALRDATKLARPDRFLVPCGK
jgi:hypothetical protein